MKQLALHVMKARYRSRCNICNQYITIGEQIVYFPDSKKAVHLSCHAKFENMKKVVQPKSTPIPMHSGNAKVTLQADRDIQERLSGIPFYRDRQE